MKNVVEFHSIDQVESHFFPEKYCKKQQMINQNDPGIIANQYANELFRLGHNPMNAIN